MDQDTLPGVATQQPPVTSMEAFLLVEAETQNLLLKQAVVVVSLYEDQFISCLFLVEKEDVSY